MKEFNELEKAIEYCGENNIKVLYLDLRTLMFITDSDDDKLIEFDLTEEDVIIKIIAVLQEELTYLTHGFGAVEEAKDFAFDRDMEYVGFSSHTMRYYVMNEQNIDPEKVESGEMLVLPAMYSEESIKDEVKKFLYAKIK